LEWRPTRDQLADTAQVAVATLADSETGRRQPHPRTLQAIRTALEAAGVEFIADNGGGAGCGCGITNGLLTFEASHILPLGLYPSSCRVWHDSHIRTRMAYGT
jgi:hypothetical protein